MSKRSSEVCQKGSYQVFVLISVHFEVENSSVLQGSSSHCNEISSSIILNLKKGTWKHRNITTDKNGKKQFKKCFCDHWYHLGQISCIWYSKELCGSLEKLIFWQKFESISGIKKSMRKKARRMSGKLSLKNLYTP